MNDNATKKNEKHKRRSWPIVLLAFLTLLIVTILILSQIASQPLVGIRDTIFSRLEQMGLSTKKIAEINLPFIDLIPPFENLPLPQQSVADVGGVYTAFLDPNGARDIVYVDGVLWAIPAQGQGLVAWDPKSGKYHHYTSFDGLASNSINQITSDGDGNILATTDGSGIVKFDGEQWFKLDAPELSRILITDSGGRTWFSNWNGSRLTSSIDSQWESYAVLDDYGVNYITDAISCSDGSVYFQGDHILRFMDDEFKMLDLEDKSVAAGLRIITCADANSVLLVDNNNNSYILKNGELSLGPSTEKIEDQIDLGLTTYNGQILFTTYDELGNGSLHQIVDNQIVLMPYEGEKITALKSFRNGEYFVSNSNEIVKIDDKEIIKRYLDTENSAPRQIFDICTDPDGSIWVAGGSIYHYINDGWQKFTNINGVEELDARQCAVTISNTWFTNQAGSLTLVSIKGSAWKTKVIDSKNITDVYDLAGGKDQLAVSTDQGIFGLDENSDVSTSLAVWKIPGLQSKVSIDEDGTVWAFVSGSGIYGFKEDEIKSIVSDDPRFNTITVINIDENLAVAEAKGVNVFDGEQFNLVLGSPMNITDILYASGKLWVATGEVGVWEFENGWKAQIKTGTNAIPEKTIEKIAMDGNQNLWMKIHGGLFKYALNDNYRDVLVMDQSILDKMSKDLKTYFFPILFN